MVVAGLNAFGPPRPEVGNDEADTRIEFAGTSLDVDSILVD